MHPTMYHGPHLSFPVVLLIGVTLLSLLILGITAVMQSRRIHYKSEWRWHFSGDGFQGPADWSDINQGADTLPASADGGDTSWDGGTHH